MYPQHLASPFNAPVVAYNIKNSDQSEMMQKSDLNLLHLGPGQPI